MLKTLLLPDFVKAIHQLEFYGQVFYSGFESIVQEKLDWGFPEPETKKIK